MPFLNQVFNHHCLFYYYMKYYHCKFKINSESTLNSPFELISPFFSIKNSLFFPFLNKLFKNLIKAFSFAKKLVKG